MTTPTISVLMTAYNRADYIAAAIESVLTQTFEDFELIVCDNHSTDATADIIREFAARDPRIRLVVNDTNIGQFGNRRKAAGLARAPFLKYHDSDDVMYRHCLAAMIEPLRAEPRAGFALSGGTYWPGGACPMLLTPTLAYEREFLGSGLFHLGPAAAMFRADVFNELGGFPDAGVASDYLFWLAACARVNVLLVPADLFYYRVHPNQEFAKPENNTEYAKATAAAWTALNSPSCPLTGAALGRAKRNFVYTTFRVAFRYLRRRQPGSALATIRFASVTPVEWLRYLRPPHRTPTAGTPPENSAC